MAYQISKGSSADCHCFGQIHSEPVSKKSLIRNVILAIPAIVLALPDGTRQGLDLGSNTHERILAAAVFSVISLLIVAILMVKQIRDGQKEFGLNSGHVHDHGEGSVERQDAGHPTDGLPIGAPFPAFDLPVMNGGSRSLDSLLSAGKPLLLFFVSPTCEPCKLLLPEIHKWREPSIRTSSEFILLAKARKMRIARRFG